MLPGGNSSALIKLAHYQEKTFLDRAGFTAAMERSDSRLNSIEKIQAKMIGALILLSACIPVILGLSVFLTKWND